jgi:hypothetical protein
MNRFVRIKHYHLGGTRPEARHRTILASRSWVSASSSRKDPILDEERRDLASEAKTLTLRLFRTCMRSARAIRSGNESDEKEFQERERKRLERRPDDEDTRLAPMMSMMPPVDREDELRSRYEYYQQYTHENFVQESDCLPPDEWNEQHIDRYLQNIRRGEEQRKWLLQDMKFKDPYRDYFDSEGVERFKKRALLYIAKVTDRELENLPPEVREHFIGSSRRETVPDGADDEDGIWDEDDEEDESEPLPEWYKNPRSGGSR